MNLKLLVYTYMVMSSLAYTDDMLAEISFFDLGGKMHSFTLPYLIKPQKVQYGVKFGIMIYDFDVVDCKLAVGDNTLEYFAAHVVLPPDCNAIDVLKDAISHGADFVFANVTKLKDYESIVTKTFDIPVLPIDKSYEEDIFSFKEVDFDRRYINIEFIMVR